MRPEKKFFEELFWRPSSCFWTYFWLWSPNKAEAIKKTLKVLAPKKTGRHHSSLAYNPAESFMCFLIPFSRSTQGWVLSFAGSYSPWGRK